MNLLSETSGYQPNNSVLLRALSNVKMVMKILYLLYLCNYNPPLNTSPYHIETLDFQSTKGRFCLFYYVTTFMKHRGATSISGLKINKTTVYSNIKNH